ncbi:MAG TPA: glycerol-3-phosphate acyltransferase [Mycobacteriales bacterium]|nr:glycerol-3-phosphate acyltransferase [Mycobacteriales bacterium]
MRWLLVSAVVVGYVIGAVSPATWIASRRGVDLRGVGSGNPGASNAGRALGRRTGVLVALLDVAKGAVPAAAFGALDHEAGLLAGIAAVLGHVTSPYLRGRGGKGVATAAGAILGSHPLWAVVVLASWALVFGVSRWIALASMSASLVLVAVSFVVGTDVLWAAAIAAIVLIRHRDNVVRRISARKAPPGEEEARPA